MITVHTEGAKTPTRLDRLPDDLPGLKRWLDRVARRVAGILYAMWRDDVPYRTLPVRAVAA